MTIDHEKHVLVVMRNGQHLAYSRTHKILILGSGSHLIQFIPRHDSLRKNHFTFSLETENQQIRPIKRFLKKSYFSSGGNKFCVLIYFSPNDYDEFSIGVAPSLLQLVQISKILGFLLRTPSLKRSYWRIGYLNAKTSFVTRELRDVVRIRIPPQRFITQGVGLKIETTKLRNVPRDWKHDSCIDMVYHSYI